MFLPRSGKFWCIEQKPHFVRVGEEANLQGVGYGGELKTKNMHSEGLERPRLKRQRISHRVGIRYSVVMNYLGRNTFLFLYRVVTLLSSGWGYRARSFMRLMFPRHRRSEREARSERL